MATKSISQLDSASTMALGDLLEIAEPNAQSVSGYTSKKISIGSQLAPYIQGTVQNASLNTTDKTLVGAINEVDSEGVKWSENNILGAKNLLKYPYYFNSQVINGIKWTVNSDGTVTATGTATANSNFYLHTRNEGELNDFVLQNGTYILSDGLATHSSNIEIQMGITKNGAYSEVALTRNGDVQFTAAGDDYSQNSINPIIQCLVRSGQQNVNVTFKPMIRLASIADNTYTPPSQTNRQLTINKAEITDLEDAYTDVYNLLHQPYYDQLQNKSLYRGVTWALNQNGVNASGTATGGNSTYIFRSWQDGFMISKNETYHLEGCPNGGSLNSYYLSVQFVDSVGATLGYAYDIGKGIDFILPTETAAIGIIMTIKQNYAISGTINIVPKLIVSRKFPSSEVAPIENGANASQSYTIGDYIVWRGLLYKVTAAISQGGAITEGTNITKTTIGAELKAALS